MKNKAHKTNWKIVFRNKRDKDYLIDPFINVVGEDNKFLIIKSKMGVNNKIYCYRKFNNIIKGLMFSSFKQVCNKNLDESREQVIITLGGTGANHLHAELSRENYTLGYPIKEDKLSHNLKNVLVREKI